MIEVFGIVHDFHHLEAAVKLNFNTFRVVSMWNSLPNDIIEAHTINTFKNRLDKY